MPLSPYMTVLEVVNEVLDSMKVRRVTVTTANLLTKTMINQLNSVIEDLLDMGTWNELTASAAFTLVSGEAVYSVATTANVTAKWYMHSIQEVSLSGRVAPLEPIADKAEFRMLSRNGSFGTPSRYCIEGIDSLNNPRVGIFPRPSSRTAGTIAHVKFQALPPRLEASTDDGVVVPFPGRVLVAGLLAATILDEAGGAPTEQYKMQMGRYMKLANSSLGRQSAKTGEFTRFQPGMTSRS